MTKVIFVLGLCGSGKTWLADHIVATEKFDEDFLNDPKKHADLIKALRSIRDCVVVEIAYCLATYRDQIVSELREAVPQLTIIWLCIENNLEKANKNCRERTNKDDPNGHINMNKQYSPLYTYPDDGVILRMWTRDG